MQPHRGEKKKKKKETHTHTHTHTHKRKEKVGGEGIRREESEEQENTYKDIHQEVYDMIQI